MSDWGRRGKNETDAGDTRPVADVRRATVARPARWTADPSGNVELWHAVDERNESTACGLAAPPNWPRVSSLPPTVFERGDMLCWKCGQIRRRRLTESGAG